MSGPLGALNRLQLVKVADQLGQGVTDDMEKASIIAATCLWPARVEHIARNFHACLLLSLFCASGGFSRVPDAMELSV